MLTTIPYDIHFNIIHGQQASTQPIIDRDTKSWIKFLFFHMLSTTTFHSISVWLTVYLAYCQLRSASKSNLNIDNKLRKLSRTSSLNVFMSDINRYKNIILWIVGISIANIIICLPAYLFLTVKENFHESQKYYYLDESELNFQTKGLMFKLVFYSQSIFCKFMPCLLLVLLNSLLIRKLIKKKRNQVLLMRSNKTIEILMKQLYATRISCGSIKTNVNENEKSVSRLSFGHSRNSRNSRVSFDPSRFSKNVSFSSVRNERKKSSILFRESIDGDGKKTPSFNDSQNSDKRKYFNSKMCQNKRATSILTLTCILFLIAELPLSILTLLSITMGDSFYNNVYMPLSDIMEMIVLVSNSINFVLLCSMSSAFRKAFLSFFCLTRNEKRVIII